MSQPLSRRSRRPGVTPVQWLGVLTGVIAVVGAITETNTDPRSWTVLVQSAIGVAAATFAWFGRRLGGRLGVLWGVAQAVVVKTDGFEWIGRQTLATYIGTSAPNPLTESGTVVALNAVGGFFACAWSWFLLRQQWATPKG